MCAVYVKMSRDDGSVSWARVHRIDVTLLEATNQHRSSLTLEIAVEQSQRIVSDEPAVLVTFLERYLPRAKNHLRTSGQVVRRQDKSKIKTMLSKTQMTGDDWRDMDPTTSCERKERVHCK